MARKGRTQEELRPEGHLESPLCFFLIQDPSPSAQDFACRLPLRSRRQTAQLRPEGPLESPLCFSVQTAHLTLRFLRLNSIPSETLRSRVRVFRSLLLCLLAIALVIPIFVVRELPLLDWPNHLARIFVLQHLGDPAYIFSHYFRADWGPYPYIGMDLCLLGLSRLMPVESAGRVFAAVTALALPASVWWLMRRARVQHAELALFAALLSYEEFFLEGFLAFQAGLALCFFSVGVWLSFREKPGVMRLALTFAAVMATYFTHLIAFAICGLIIGVYALAEQRSWRKLFWSGLLFVPGILLFLHVKTAIATNHAVYMRGWRDKLHMIVEVSVHGYSNAADQLVAWILAVCIVIAIVRNRELRLRLPWAAVFAAVLLGYLLLPYAWGETFDIDLRLLPAAFVLLLLVADIGRRARPLAFVALALLALKLYVTTEGMQERSRLLAPARAAIEKIDRNSRLLPLVHAPDDEDVLDREYVHYADYAVIRRGAFVPYLFDIPGQMPLRCDPCIDAPDDFWDLEYDHPPDWQQIRRDYDYVWAWDVEKFDPDISNFADVVFTSDKLRLYRVRH